VLPLPSEVCNIGHNLSNKMTQNAQKAANDGENEQIIGDT
jgi:hypothetical protein